MANDNTKNEVVYRPDGVTPSERYLRRLCERSFLSLWSFPGVYRDQGRASRGDGKEVCDLLVVFQDHILIFSDKRCAFPNSGDLALDWCRWFRRAILSSAEQVWGAERWIRSYPGRLFLDRACTQPFPIPLPDPAQVKFHRIVVAHGASRSLRDKQGGTGSLGLAPHIVGPMHHADPKGVRPFVIGDVDPSRRFVHVLDDSSLQAVMYELDTTADFVEYLTKKESLIRSGKLEYGAGEDDLLAYYIYHKHEFPTPRDGRRLVVKEGL
jgi:hypothetical protein